MDAKTPPKRWLRKKQLRERYGGVTDRTIERAVEDGKLPPPSYPFNNKIPLWSEEELEAHERQAVLARKEPAPTGRPFQKKTATESEETAA